MKRLLPLVLALLLVGGCTTRTIDAGGMSAVGPQLSVERFLQAANARDLEAMSRIFGTAGGPIGDTGSAFGCMFKKIGSWIGLGDACLSAQTVELRMNAIALILQHDDYHLVSDQFVAGRDDPTTRVSTNIVRGPETFRDVGFLVVQASAGWLVESIELEKITAG